MLRHLKMKRQLDSAALSASSTLNNNNSINSAVNQQINNTTTAVSKQCNVKVVDEKQPISGNQQRRVRGRRSSKPQMEKRRRARINQCLDILKSYVLTDSTNLSQLGIDTLSNENKDEESIARTILKSSGLINRHRGRKNPNKLEKADILELTVDYVRRLHEQRAQLINQSHKPTPSSLYSSSEASPSPSASVSGVSKNKLNLPYTNNRSKLPLTSPLTLNLSAIDGRAHIGLQATPLSPPPSSASSSPQPLLSISNNILKHYEQSPLLYGTNDILDLSNAKRIRVQNQVVYPMHCTY